MNIIFICRHNVFRSRIAETYFNRINKNKNIHATSGGLFIGMQMSNKQKIIAKKLRVMPTKKPRHLTTHILREQDLTIIVANDIPKYLFNNPSYNHKVIRWRIPDVLDNDPKKIEKTIRLIQKKVKKLVNRLKTDD